MSPASIWVPVTVATITASHPLTSDNGIAEPFVSSVGLTVTLAPALVNAAIKSLSNFPRRETGEHAHRRAQAVQRDGAAAPNPGTHDFLHRITGKSRHRVFTGRSDFSRGARHAPGVHIRSITGAEKRQARQQNDCKKQRQLPMRISPQLE